MGKAYFDPELFQFFQQIKRNNRRPWFLKNRERYEQAVRQPCLRFITDFGFRLKEISPWMVVDPKPHGGSLLRIYRDIRFSADKTPYKTWAGISFPHARATEEVHGAGYYLQFEADRSFIAAGAWHPDRRSLAKIRDAISWKGAEWKKAKRGLSLEGDTLKRAPAWLPRNSSAHRRFEAHRFRRQHRILQCPSLQPALAGRGYCGSEETRSPGWLSEPRPGIAILGSQPRFKESASNTDPQSLTRSRSR